MNGVIIASVQPEDFRKARSFGCSSNCPLTNALRRQGYDVGNGVADTYANIDGELYSIPLKEIWGGDNAQFSSKRINKLIKLSKFHIPWSIPTAIVVLEAK